LEEKSNMGDSSRVIEENALIAKLSARVLALRRKSVVMCV
jgi:hypothetical protein